MADFLSKEKRSVVMASIRSHGNKDTELRLIEIFREKRIRGWRRHFKIEGKPDFVFPRRKVAVFVDGCFWHSCPKHGRQPQSNGEFWNAKFARNKTRDRLVTLALKRKGWIVVRIWEHNLRFQDRVAARIVRALQLSSAGP